MWELIDRIAEAIESEKAPADGPKTATEMLRKSE